MKRPCLAVTFGLALVLCAPHGLQAQIDGSTADTFAGLGLGVFSGVTLGTLGATLPCGRMLDGRRCAITAASVGAAIGIGMGGLLGSKNRELMLDRVEGAGWGSVVGAGVGVLLWPLIEDHSWVDVLAFSLVGGAVGSVPKGSLYGAGAGVAAGALTWLIIPDAGVQDFVLVSLAGIAVGGMVDWAEAANRKKPPSFGGSFSIPF